ncbi:MAG: IS110 family transposase [Bacteroidales bacterium]|nr:IS110 family transposase [Bacteroidales bacterium]
MSKIKQKKVARKAKQTKKVIQGLPVLHYKAAGADIGDTQHDIAISDGRGGFIVRTFKTFTADVKEAVKWLKDEGITTVAMESTGVYYLTFYLLLEEAGIEPYLVNARHVKNVTGRKKDDTDAMWIQRLHSCGLLQKSFQPDNDFRTLRTYVRQRKGLITRCSDEVRRMQKALEQMNIKIHTVISDLLGKTGIQIVKAIIEGNFDPEELSKLRDPRIKATPQEVFKSLQGLWKEEYVFTLKQAYNTYCFYQQQVKECEDKIHEQLLKQIAQVNQGDITLDKPTIEKKTKPRKNQFSFPVAPLLCRLTTVDLCKIPGLSEVSILEFIAETGIDMDKWNGSKQFAAWLNLVPNTKITGGKIISSRMLKKKNTAGQTLRMGASSLYSNKTAMGDYHRRMSAKYGGKGAALASAHKMSRIIYKMLKAKVEFNFQMLADADQKYRERKIKHLEKLLQQLKKVA